MIVSPRRFLCLFCSVVILLIASGVNPPIGNAQDTITLSGEITDSESGEALSYASILLKGTYIGTTSDQNGNYSIVLNSPAPHTLLFSYIGYRTEEIVIDDISALQAIDVQLEVRPIGTNAIVITSQLREQELQEVPASVAVLDQSTISKIRVLDYPADLVAHTPGLSGNLLSVDSRLTIRGIGSDAFGIGLESSIGIFVDDVYAGRVTSSFSFLDVERIEVIKGPQNTLFGRNASAGVISVISHKPRNNKSLEITTGLGNESQQDLKYVINYPLLKNLYARFAGRISKRAGVRTVANFDNQEIGKLDVLGNRFSLLYRPDNKSTLHFSIERIKDDVGAHGLYSRNPDLGVSGNVFDREIELNIESAASSELFSSRLQIDRVLSQNMLLKSVTGLRINNGGVVVDGDGSPINSLIFINNLHASTFSQDLRLIGANKNIDWLVAGNAFVEHIDNVQSMILDDFFWVGDTSVGENELGTSHPAFFICDDFSDSIFGACNQEAREDNPNDGTFNSYGVYGNLEWGLTANARLGIGLRYTIDHKKFVTSSALGNGVLHQVFANNIAGSYTVDEENVRTKTWKGLQPRIAFSYALKDNFMLFSSYARGYKAGGFNTITANPFDAETSNAFELGFKSETNNKRFKFNLSAYFTDYEDLQVQDLLNAVITISNAAEVESQGIEFEAVSRPSKHLTFIANAAIGKARYNNYTVGSSDFSGNTTARSPDNTFSLIGQWNQPISNLGELVFRVDYNYQSKVYFSRENLEEVAQAGYGILNLYAGLENLLNDRLTIALVGHNLIDEAYLVHAEQALPFSITNIRSIPRLISMKASFRLSD